MDKTRTYRVFKMILSLGGKKAWNRTNWTQQEHCRIARETRYFGILRDICITVPALRNRVMVRLGFYSTALMWKLKNLIAMSTHALLNVSYSSKQLHWLFKISHSLHLTTGRSQKQTLWALAADVSRKSLKFLREKRSQLRKSRRKKYRRQFGSLSSSELLCWWNA